MKILRVNMTEASITVEDLPRALSFCGRYNAKAGLSGKDDRLARFFYEEPLPPHNKVFLISDEDLDSVHNQ